MEQNRLDDLIDDIHKKGMSICEFCKNNDYCRECSEITTPPTPLYAFCKVFYKDCLEEAAE